MKTLLKVLFSRIAPALWLSACMTQQPAVRTWVDQKTAAAVTAQWAPLVLARDVFEQGVNVRDYAEVSAIEVNQAGKRRVYLAVVAWSTIPSDGGQSLRLDAAFAHVKMWADDRPIELRKAQSRSAIGLNAQPVALPSPTAQEFYYLIDAKDLYGLVMSSRVTLEDAEQNSYRLWRDRRADLRAFLQALPGGVRTP